MNFDLAEETDGGVLPDEAVPLLDTPPGEPAIVVEPAPVAAKAAAPSMLFLVSSLVGGNFVSMLLRMLGGFLQAKCVLPAVLGLYGSFILVLGYVPFLQLGILTGINRELPYFIGKGDRQRVQELAAAAQAWALAVGGIVGLALCGIGCWQLAHGEWQLAAGWYTTAVLTVLLFYNTNYLQLTYRTSHDFARLAMSSVVENSVSLVLVVLVALFSFYGLCLRALLTALVSVAFLQYWRPVRVGPRWNWRHLKHLLVVGAPIFVVSQVYLWWVVLNSTLVLSYTGEQGMGLYAMVLMAGQAMELLPTALAQIIYPRMAEQYGRTGRLGDLVRMSVKPTLFSVLGTAPLVVIGWWLMGPVVRLLLPNYVDAVPAMQWSIVVSFVACFTTVNAVFPVLRRLGLYAVAIVLGMATYGGCLLWLMRDGVSLVAFAQAMLIGRVAMTVICFLFIGWLVWQSRKHPVGR